MAIHCGCHSHQTSIRWLQTGERECGRNDDHGRIPEAPSWLKFLRAKTDTEKIVFGNITINNISIDVHIINFTNQN
jgi:hypothetical protein